MNVGTDLLNTLSPWLPILGAATGILGAVISIINYRRVSNIKALDLRLDLRRKSSDYVDLVNRLPAQMDHARRSHLNVSAALGLSGSGNLVAWEQEFDTDIATTGKLKLTTPQFIGDFKSLSRDELEAKLVELHGLDGRARRIKEKYTTVVAADDSDRVFLRDNAHANFRAEISAPHVQGKKLLGG